MVDTRRNSHPASNSGPRSSLGSQPHGGSGKGTGKKGNKDKTSEADSAPYVFTARTCLELLPYISNPQVENEIKHLRALDAGVHAKLLDRSTINDKRDLLHSSLTNSLMLQIDTVVNKYDSLLESISRKVESTEKKLDEAQQKMTQRMTEAQQQVEELLQTPITSPAPQATTRESEDMPQDQPVRFLDVSFGGISYDDVLNSFNLDKSLPGNRKSAYFGDIAYSYGHKGHISHDPAAYPTDHPIFTRIFDTIQEHDPDFTPEHYTCLVTNYRNGHSSLGMHQDNETCISPGSNIYTVSFGEPRTLRLFNTKGPLQEQLHTLEHGSVNVMTRESQSSWKHGIVRDPQIREGRISLTFRRLVPASSPSTPPSQSTVPPIAPPPEQPKKPVRVLLLTDSIHSSTPDYLFETIPNHVCIKQIEYQLENFDKWSSQFSYTDYVILSMGINDLSRYGHSAKSLADCVIQKLKFFCHKFPRTKFIFNSVLLTRDHDWCNREVKTFNSIVHDLSRFMQNLYFFDSDGILVNQKPFAGNKSFYEGGSRSSLTDSSMRDARSNNGIHISLEMRRLIMSELVRGVGFLSGCRSEKFRSCNWMYNVTSRSSH